MLNSNYIGKPYNCTKEICDKPPNGFEYCYENSNGKSPTLSFLCKKGTCNFNTGLCTNIPSIEGFNTREWNECRMYKNTFWILILFIILLISMMITTV